MLAYDTHILIYALEGGSDWAEAAQAVVQKGEQDGAVLSVLAWQELMTGAVLNGDGLDDRVAAALQDLQAAKFVPVTPAISKRAAELTKRYGRRIYGYDAIHLATAIEHKAEAFITNDARLLGTPIQEIPVRGL